MVNADPASLGGTGAVRNAPAPWVPYTRAGCDVGNVGVANTVLENNTAIAFRNTPGAHVACGGRRRPAATNIKVTSVDGLAAGQTLVIENGDCEPRTRDDRDRRHGRRCRHGRRPHRTAGEGARERRPVNVHAPDPTGDMTKVFGAGSPEWNEGRDSQIAPGGTAARALAQTDFVGIAIHCADPAKAAGICTDNERREARHAPR